MIFTFVLLPLSGCGSSSLLEAKTPAPEAIKLAEDRLKHVRTDEKVFQDEKITEEKTEWKRKQLSDAEKFIGISEEWEFVGYYKKRSRYKRIVPRDKTNPNAPLVWEWDSWEPWEARTFKCIVRKQKGEWQIGRYNNDGSFDKWKEIP
jgi:hypothetical protein